ncbi:hypothetical protein H5410_036942 [Solanum commersonii]|uniref:Uncharacterized protein n=1 Tax=Solanum commersonii TaxID=4109 RepID=A0A9J5Y9Q3_SOLCO|nr:hypothetical protein H5410_036942 [Solanum commersonii]
MVRTNLDMPPRKRARCIGGKGKGKRPVIEVPKHNFGSEGESFDSQDVFSEPNDDQPLQSRRVEIHVRSRPDSSRAPATTPPTADTIPAPAPTMAPNSKMKRMRLTMKNLEKNKNPKSSKKIPLNQPYNTK